MNLNLRLLNWRKRLFLKRIERNKGYITKIENSITETENQLELIAYEIAAEEVKIKLKNVRSTRKAK